MIKFATTLSSPRRLACAFLLLSILFGSPAVQAAYDVAVVASGASRGGAWIGNTWTASAAGAQVLAAEIVSHLTAGATAVNTGSGGAENGDITVKAAIAWNANTLTLHADRDINVNAALTGAGTAKLVLEYGQGAAAAGNTALYQITVPVSLMSDAADPRGTASLSFKRGSDGVVDARTVPACPVAGRFGTVYGCSFLKNSDETGLAVQYQTVEINADPDVDKWLHVDAPRVFGAAYYPFVMSCAAGQGQILYPTSKAQAQTFDATGAISDAVALAAATTLQRACKTWQEGPVLPLLSSADFANGYYFKFTPNAGESGNGYQILSVLSAPMPEANVGYKVVDYVINVGRRPVTSYRGATGAGEAVATVSGGGSCGFTTSRFIPVANVPTSPPPGLVFPQGLFDFTLGGGCTPGGTVTLAITYPQGLPPGSQYWKYGPTASDAAPHWYVLPATIAGNTATFSITDGGLGDDDLAANGVIVDQGGPAAEPLAVPTLSPWLSMLLSLSLLFSCWGWRECGARRRGVS